jgi:phenylpropionate dioxygenase-like ring-hydroxylating dioxygenase large terminal subunit
MTLPAKYFIDPEVFHAEMERFYFQKWICAGRE